MGSRLVGLHLKSTLESQLSTVSSTWLIRGGAALQGQLGPRSQSIRIQKTKDMVNTVGAQYP